MIFMNLFFGQDNSSYNMSMIFVYLLILFVAFIICILVSNRLNIYNSRVNKNINTKISITNELQVEALNEAAATSEEVRGAEDEQ